MSADPGEVKGDRDSGQLVRVIGAGFSGLTTANYLASAGFKVEIYDALLGVGGMIQTQVLAHGRVESAANGILNSPLVEDLFRQLNLPLQGTLAHARKRYVFREGRPHRWSLKFFETVGFLMKLPFIFIFRKQLAPRSGETIAQFGRRILGLRASQFTIETFLQGIYAGDPQRLSASQILQRFFPSDISSTKKPKSIPRRRPIIRGTVAPVGGMHKLMSSLEASLRMRGVTFFLDYNVTKDEIHTWSMEAPVVVATSAVRACELLQENGIFNSAVRLSVASSRRTQALKQIEMLPMITATVFFDRGLPIEGFGCLFPPSESHQALGVLLNNYIFEGAASGAFSETWMLGGALFTSPFGDDVSRLSEEQVLELVRECRKKSFKVNAAIVGCEIKRWPTALPHYTVEIERVMPHLQGLQDNILLMGNYLGQIGLAKILERASLVPNEISSKGQWHEQ